MPEIVIVDHLPLPEVSVDGLERRAHLLLTIVMVPPGWYAELNVMSELENAVVMLFRYPRNIFFVSDFVPGWAQFVLVSIKPAILILRR